MRRSLLLLAVHLDDRDADDQQAGFDAAVLDGDADALGLGIGVLVAELHPWRKDQLRRVAAGACGLLRLSAAAAGLLRGLGRLGGLRGLGGRRRAAFAGAAAAPAACDPPTTASVSVAVSAANILLAVRAVADMVRYVIRCSSFPPVFAAPPVRAPIACLDAPKKAGA